MASRTFTQTRTRTQTQTRTSTDEQQTEDEGRYRVNFGTHNGRTLDEVPASWIRWVITQGVYETRSDLKKALEERGDLKKGAAKGKRAGSPVDKKGGSKKGGGGEGGASAGGAGASKKGPGGGGSGSGSTFVPFQSAGNTLGG